MDPIEIMACAPRLAGDGHSIAAMLAFVGLAWAFRGRPVRLRRNA